MTRTSIVLRLSIACDLSRVVANLEGALASFSGFRETETICSATEVCSSPMALIDLTDALVILVSR